MRQGSLTLAVARIGFSLSAPPFSARARAREKVQVQASGDDRHHQILECDIFSAIALNTMATNSIKLLTGNSYPELARLVADRYVHILPHMTVFEATTWRGHLRIFRPRLLSASREHDHLRPCNSIHILACLHSVGQSKPL
jgi:hypothetical protein